MTLLRSSYLVALLLAHVLWLQPQASGEDESRWKRFLLEGEKHLSRGDLALVRGWHGRCTEVEAEVTHSGGRQGRVAGNGPPLSTKANRR